MNSPMEYAAYYLDRMREGESEDAFFGLIHADPAVLPLLKEACGKDENREIRAEIIRCIWEYRRPEDIAFLAEMLHDPVPGVWQEALDGIVALGGREAVQALQDALAKIRTAGVELVLTEDWIAEALEQLREAGAEASLGNPRPR